MAKNNKRNYEAKLKNDVTFASFYWYLLELAICMFEWKNLPKEIDPRYLELTLLTHGKVVFFKDIIPNPITGDMSEQYLTLPFNGRRLDIYRNYWLMDAYAETIGYHKQVNADEGVAIYNNHTRTPCVPTLYSFAERLANLYRTTDINIAAQKTPLLFLCDESQRLAITNVYKDIKENSPAVFGDKRLIDTPITVIKTDAPYVADKLFDAKELIMNDVMTYLGISNIGQKNERYLVGEVGSIQGTTMASRYTRLATRREGCKKINDMFGFKGEKTVWCDYREDFRYGNVASDTIEGEPNSDGIGGDKKVIEGKEGDEE